MSVVPTALAKGEGKPAIVFLHGVGSEATIWRPQLAHFGATRMALAWTMPGYDNAGVDLGALGWTGLADALAHLLDIRGLDRVHLVGHSIGGMVAQTFAARHGDRLASLVLSATSPAFGRPDGDWQAAFVRERLAPIEAGQTLAEFGPDALSGLMGPQPDAAGLKLAQASIRRVNTPAYAAAIRLIVTFDGRADLERIRVPTLVLAGETDTNAPAPMMEKMAAKIPGATYHCLPGHGHLANVEDSVAFNAAIDGFLRHENGS